MKYLKYLVGTILMFILWGCGNPEDRTLATINGSPITFKEFYQDLQTKPTAKVILGNQEVTAPIAGTLAMQAFQDLINQKLIVQLAKQEGYQITEPDVNHEIEFRKKLNPFYLEEFLNRGYSIGQIREEVKTSLASEKLWTQGIHISKKEVDDYIQKHPQQFMHPATVTMYWIYILNKNLEPKINQELMSGQSFSSVAIQYSQYPGAKEVHGMFPQNQINLLPPAIKQVVNQTNAGQQSNWVPIGKGFAKFFVQQKTQTAPIVMTADRKFEIQRMLAIQQGQLANDVNKQLTTMLEKSKIQVDYTPLQKPWKTFIKQLKETVAPPNLQPNLKNPATAPAPSPKKTLTKVKTSPSKVTTTSSYPPKNQIKK